MILTATIADLSEVEAEQLCAGFVVVEKGGNELFFRDGQTGHLLMSLSPGAVSSVFNMISNEFDAKPLEIKKLEAEIEALKKLLKKKEDVIKSLKDINNVILREECLNG